ncbi:hypothetical protein P168DRAFT_275828 [Aspergillus campestris IBT 28561]|uniref:Uncharacterized protein n=1 Tax=Aspergillus campestris (strain IBT 28561) TaxID=1392248 RepID=A0A2I1CSD8_ASPC2|nr:uncharacterized protein P168DRAFT_275828 [Aspergillus campestris IBT 28561]PKY00527.1 hypothetical protein P168DRAFT_275828 [Aspergillus campestris IBT 28561]
MPPKKPAGGRKKDAIHFVNARPASENERLRIQRLVRAHVGKWISDQTKDRGEPGENAPVPSGDQPRPADPPTKPELDDALVTVPSPSSARSSPSTQSSGSSNPPSFTLAVRTSPKPTKDPEPQQTQKHSVHTDSQDASEQEKPVLDPSSPPQQSVEVIGASAMDPFATYPVTLHYPPEFVSACESYSVQILWPGLTPGNGVSAVRSWFPLSLSEPTLFTTFLYGSLSHQRVQWINRWIPEAAFSPRDQQLLHFCEMESIKLIQHDISQPDRAVQDAVILSVMCMAHNNADINDARRHRRTPFTPPMQRLQWLDIYGSLPPNLIHTRGLAQLVQIRGGLKNIRLPGLAPILSFSDIMTSTTFLVPPAWEFIALREEHQDVSLHELVGYNTDIAEQQFGSLRAIGGTTQMIDIFCAMKTYMNHVDVHLRHQLSTDDTSLLADRRNLIQYHTLHIPTATQLGGSAYDPPFVLYETCRMTALIYSAGVVFPMPAQSNPMCQLAASVRNLLVAAPGPEIWSHPQARVILMWALTLGGIATQGRPERPWYVSMLRQTTADNHIDTWEALRKILLLMLWHDPSCEVPGRRLWAEVEESHTAPTPA